MTPNGEGRPAKGASPSSASGSRLGPGELLAERYRIVRFVAKGGMGEVFEVEDLLLGTHLALKTVLPDLEAEPDTIERFKREILLARRISHPSVCRIHDLGSHRAAAGADPSEDLLFLTMEFLEGGTLAQRLREGRMTPGEALPIVEQMAAGLAAAHDAGVIHRDFKPGNVMLVPSQGRPLRAVVTDFGLARTASGAGSLHTISGTGHILGTPAYMAPEQVLGKPLTPAVDVYALGLVVYEMVTGVRPFVGGSPFSVAARRLSEAPESPRLHREDLPPSWEAAILRCLEVEPGARFERVQDLVAALKGEAGPPRDRTVALTGSGSLSRERAARASGAARGFGFPRGRLALLSAAAVALLAVSAGGLWLARGRASAPKQTTPVAVRVRRAVAVLPIVNGQGKAGTAWQGAAFGELLGAELGASGELRVVPAGRVLDAQRDLKLEPLRSLPSDLGEKLRGRLGADLFVLGSYEAAGGEGGGLLRLELRLHQAGSDEPLATGSATGSGAQMVDLVTRAGASLLQKAGIKELTPSAALRVSAALPAGEEAARAYVEGLSRLAAFDRTGARALLVKAAELDPRDPRIQLALATVLQELGETLKAAETATKATALAVSLPEPDRLAVEARAWEVAKDHDKAAAAWTELLARSPDDLEAGLSLASSQLSAGKANGALVTLERLQALPAPLGDDPRLDLLAARARQQTNDAALQETLASRAAEAARRRGDRLVEAQSLLGRSIALLRLGRTPEAVRPAEEARALFDAAGDRSGGARCLEQLAAGLVVQGDLEGARRLYERAFEVHRQVGAHSDAARVLSNLAQALLDQGKAAESEKRNLEALETFRRNGAMLETASALNTLGASAFARGDLPLARKRYEEALSLWSGLGQKGFTAMALTNIGEVLRLGGDLKGARGMHEEALATNRSLGDKAGAAFDLRMLAEVFLLQDDLTVARQRTGESAALCAELKDRLGEADGQYLLSRIALAEGNADAALAAAQAAGQVYRAEGAHDRAALARAAESEAHLAQGKRSEADEDAREALRLAAEREDLRGLLVAAIARVRSVAKGEPKESKGARDALASMAETARNGGMTTLWLEARLALAESLLASGDAGGRREAGAVLTAAREKGLGLLIRRARVLAGS